MSSPHVPRPAAHRYRRPRLRIVLAASSRRSRRRLVRFSVSSLRRLLFEFIFILPRECGFSCHARPRPSGLFRRRIGVERAPAGPRCAPAADGLGHVARRPSSAAGTAAPTGAPVLAVGRPAVAAPIARAARCSAPTISARIRPVRRPAVGRPSAGQPVVCTGPQGTRQLCLPAGSANASVAGSGGWTNYHVDATVTISGTPAGGGASLLGRIQPNGNFYEFEVRPDVNGSGQWFGGTSGTSTASGTCSAGKPLASPPGPTFAMRFDLNGSQLSGYIGASAASLVPLGSITDQSYVAGGVGVRNFGATAADFGAVTVTSDGGAASGTTASAPPTTMNPQPGSAAPSSLPTEVPRSAGAFIAGTGINMHTGAIRRAVHREHAAYGFAGHRPRDQADSGRHVAVPADDLCRKCALRRGRHQAQRRHGSDLHDGRSQRWSACVGRRRHRIGRRLERIRPHPSRERYELARDLAKRAALDLRHGEIAARRRCGARTGAHHGCGRVRRRRFVRGRRLRERPHVLQRPFPRERRVRQKNYGSIAAILAFAATTSASRRWPSRRRASVPPSAAATSAKRSGEVHSPRHALPSERGRGKSHLCTR